jgi:hypothetical protein
MEYHVLVLFLHKRVPLPAKPPNENHNLAGLSTDKLEQEIVPLHSFCEFQKLLPSATDVKHINATLNKCGTNTAQTINHRHFVTG